MRSEDPLEQLARLAGTSGRGVRPGRSIFDDPEDLDELEVEESLPRLRVTAFVDREPDLVDLEEAAQSRICRFAIEERLEHGLPPIELLELYRTFELAGDDRARQYLDRVFVDKAPPPDWLELQAQAQQALELGDYRKRDAGHMLADVFRTSPEIDPYAALQLVIERLRLGIGGPRR
jgi:hypothetical protein